MRAQACILGQRVLSNIKSLPAWEKSVMFYELERQDDIYIKFNICSLTYKVQTLENVNKSFLKQMSEMKPALLQINFIYQTISYR